MLDLGGGADLGGAPGLEIESERGAASARRNPPARRDPGSGKVSGGGRASTPGRPEGAATRALAVALAQRGVTSRAQGTPAQAKDTARSQATARSGVVPRAAPATPAMPHAGGRLLGGDGLHDDFGSAAGPGLELDRPQVQRAQGQGPIESSIPPAPVIETPEQAQARTIRELARYGEAPKPWYGAPLYAVRVMLRKRELEVELNALSAQRKRADDAAQEALAKLGEAIYARRSDPELAPLAKQLAVVANAESHVGQVQAEAHKRKQDSQQELVRLDAEIERLERLAEPLKEREAKAAASVDELKARARRSDLSRRKVETEMEALQKSKNGVDPERWAALQNERERHHGEVQSLGIQLRPVEDELSVVRRELALHMKTIAGLQDEKQWAATTLERAQQNQRVSEGSARGARQQILVSLAQSARKRGLVGGFPDALAAVTETSERVSAKRQQEDLHRSAVESFDPEVYQKGITILLGGSGFVLLSLTLMILI